MRILLMVGVFTTLIGAYIWNMWLSPDDSIKPVSPLKLAIQECDGIATKAAAQLPTPVVEFQKLENAGRQARVFRICMNDHGYVESVAWLKRAEQQAAPAAKQQAISLNEAVEQLRRAAMMQAEPVAQGEVYWVLNSRSENK